MILEREAQFTELRRILDDLDSLGGRVILVRGEAGIGKSALVSGFLAATADEAHVLVGGCDDLRTPRPLDAVWDLARDEPRIATALSSGDRRAMMEVLLDLLSRGLRPTVLVIEDIQWADQATLDVVKFLGRRIRRTNGLLILTYRDGEVDTDHPLRQVIGDLPPANVVRLRLEPLSREAIASMVGDIGLDVAEVVALTDGNPLFVTEVLASGGSEVPASISDSVAARVARLSPESRRVLDLVSVMPGEVEWALVEDMLAVPRGHLIECERQGLIRFDGRTVAFSHELTRRAVEASLSTPDRHELNELVLTHLSEHADPARLAHHAREAEDMKAILEFAPRAARAAMAVESHREALAHFRTLVPYVDRLGEADRASIFDDWARNEFYMDNVEALDILEQAIALHRAAGADRALARALTFAVRVNEVNGRPRAAEACSLEALRIYEAYLPDGDLAFAVSQRAWLSLMRGDLAGAGQFAARAMAIAEQVGDRLTLIHSMNTRGFQMYVEGDPSGLELLEECRRQAEQAGYPFEEARALVNMAGAAAELRQVELAGDLARRARDTAARYEIRALEAYARAQLAQILSWTGDWTAAEDMATEVLGSHPHVEVLAGSVLGVLQAREGRSEARITLERTWSLAEANAEPQNLGPAAAALAEHMWLTGHRDAGQIDRFQQILRETRHLGAPWLAGSLAFWLWKLGSLPETPDWIAEPYRMILHGECDMAAALWEASSMPYERALALAQGDNRVRLEALGLFEGLGATAVAAKLRRALRDEGIAVPRGKSRSTREHMAGLTARQAEVLDLLAEGLSNTEIADRLFVSHRTIENHVSAVLMKLDVATRDAAVQAARARGLLVSG